MKDILILTKENCPLCKRLKKEFERNGIIYRELDAENDIDGMAYVHFYGLANTVLPRIIINEEVIPPYETIQETLDAVMKYIRGPAYVGRDPIESY